MRTILFCLIIIFFTSCQTEDGAFVRPRQYPRLNLPSGSLMAFDNTECPFQMNIPDYFKTEKKKFLFGNEPANPCWFDLEIPTIGATIHCSYYPIEEDGAFDKFVNDAFTMASKHNIKASHREEFVIKNKNGSSGLVFKISGPVATPYQFYMSDSTNHFLRGSLYFANSIQPDSMAPYLSFLEKDIEQMLASLKWKN